MLKAPAGSYVIRYGGITVHVFPNVYKPSDDTFLLLDNLNVKSRSKVLELGCGCGILSVTIALTAGFVLAVDVSPYSVLCTKFNVRLNRVSNKVEVVQGDLFAFIKKDHRFDTIVFNPPYLPGEGKDWIEKAWAGGPNGRLIIDRFLGEVRERVKRGGNVQMVLSSISNVEKTIDGLRSAGFEPKIVARKSLPFFESLVVVHAKRL